VPGGGAGGGDGGAEALGEPGRLVGIALTRPSDVEDATDELWKLVDRADAAMYEAKQQGRDRVASLWVPMARLPMAEESTGRAGPAASGVG